MHFMKEGIFMNQEVIKATLLEKDGIDILRFKIDEDELEINLNSPDCQNSLKKLFTSILEKVVNVSAEITFEIQEGYSRGMYIEVCEEYIKDLNRELGEVIELIKEEIIELSEM